LLEGVGWMKALNFYSTVYHGNILTQKKSCTIRLGDKTKKYHEGDVVLITYGNRFEPRRRLFEAVLDLVEVKPVSELSVRDISGENQDMRGVDDVLDFLGKVYGRTIGPEESVTVIYFSCVED
jgi:hypothetical protein